MSQQFPATPDRAPDESAGGIARWITLAARSINLALRGKLNAVYRVADADFTLTANAASTVLTDERLSYFSWVGFMPMTANAAAEIGAGTMFVAAASLNNGAWTITHANNSQTDRTFRVVILG